MSLKVLSGRIRASWGSGIVAAIAAISLGLLLWRVSFAQGFINLSYDLPFAFMPAARFDDVVVIAMDDDSYQKLGQTYGQRWDRSLHTRLLKRLSADQARLVVFDMFLSDRVTETVDAELAKAMNDNGKVILAAELLPAESADFRGGVLKKPDPIFSEAAMGWGIAKVSQDGPDLGVRRLFPGTMQVASLPWAAAAAIKQDLPARNSERWLNYYGPPAKTIRTIRYYEALEQEQGFFRNKFVFIGGSPKTRFVGDEVDEFSTPFTLFGWGARAGVEIIATSFLNILRGDFLTRSSPGAEFLMIVLFGFLVGFAFTLLRPVPGGLAASAFFLGIFLLAIFLFGRARVWFPWTVLAGGQIPLAFLCALVFHNRKLAKEHARILTQAEQRPPDSEGITSRDPGSGLASRVLPSFSGPQPVPDHELLRCVGKGAFGEVWLARNAVGIFDVIKLVYRSNFRSQEPFEREFHGLKQFMPISRLHPGLVQILQVGRNDQTGCIYYVMEPSDDEVTGQNIQPESYSPKNLGTEIKRREKFPARECLQLALDLSSALDFLHTQNLVHRDIKPSNIIFVRDAPKLADIGLVTEIAGTGTDPTYIGTHGYIPPEGPGRPAADIYSLGRVLYEAWTGLPNEQYPKMPDTLIGRTDRDLLMDLNDIILKACHREVQERYHTASQMHQDLRKLFGARDQIK